MKDVQKASSILPSVLTDLLEHSLTDNAVIVGKWKEEPFIQIHHPRKIGLQASLDLQDEYNVVNLSKLLVFLYNQVGRNLFSQHTILQQNKEVYIQQHQIPHILDSIDALVDYEGPLPYYVHVHTPAYSLDNLSNN
jgi:hypothetical protein|tara:strand:- start:7720 stop:8127 length:408 start_codon:yes stop_codon:yes gene_type:complete